MDDLKRHKIIIQSRHTQNPMQGRVKNEKSRSECYVVGTYKKKKTAFNDRERECMYNEIKKIEYV